jgi:hypothetical protein
MIFHDETDRSYSLSSFAEEPAHLDVTQHCRRALPDKESLDATLHHRREEPRTTCSVHRTQGTDSSQGSIE